MRQRPAPADQPFPTRFVGSALMDFASAATCPISYEALLKQGFGGSFQALPAWWRAGAGFPAAR